jgi:hypothetical protein
VVFTVNTKGAVTQFADVIFWRALKRSGFLLRKRLARVDRVVPWPAVDRPGNPRRLNALAKLGASETAQINKKAIATDVRSATADREVFVLFFILLFGMRFEE